MRHTPLNKYLLGSEGCSQRLHSARVERVREWFEVCFLLHQGWSSFWNSSLFSLFPPFPPLLSASSLFSVMLRFQPLCCLVSFPVNCFFSSPLLRCELPPPSPSLVGLFHQSFVYLTFFLFSFIPFKSLPFPSPISPSPNVFLNIFDQCRSTPNVSLLPSLKRRLSSLTIGDSERKSSAAQQREPTADIHAETTGNHHIPSWLMVFVLLNIQKTTLASFHPHPPRSWSCPEMRGRAEGPARFRLHSVWRESQASAERPTRWDAWTPLRFYFILAKEVLRKEVTRLVVLNLNDHVVCRSAL